MGSYGIEVWGTDAEELGARPPGADFVVDVAVCLLNDSRHCLLSSPPAVADAPLQSLQHVRTVPNCNFQKAHHHTRVRHNESGAVPLWDDKRPKSGAAASGKVSFAR